MIVTRKHLPRRTFLRGLGATLALPVLDAMSPAIAMAAERTQSPLRLAFSYVPNGIIMKDWTPATEGEDYAFTRILKPLEAYRKDMFVLTGLDQQNANALGDGGGDHARAGAVFLTGVHPRKTAGADVHAGISVDQFAARKVESQTQLASLELGCEESRTVGTCDSGYSCAYTNSISWRSPTSPMPPETNPRLVFERLFGTDAGLDPETRLRMIAYRKSILDLVQDQTKALLGTLGNSDRHKIDEYLYSIREIEKRIQSAEKDNRHVEPGIEEPAGIPETFAAYVRLMYDLQVLAFQTDMTRVSTMVMGREGSVRTYGEIGIPDPHHPLTHHRNNPEWIEKVTKIDTFHAELFGYFLNKMKTTPDGDGTLLDHSMVVYGSCISDGNRHLHENLPILLAGRGGGLNPGRHIVYPKGTPMANLHLTLLDRFGVEPEKIGDSTGKLEKLELSA
jgi:hypothetical protein